MHFKVSPGVINIAALLETETTYIYEYSHTNIACLTRLEDPNGCDTFSHISPLNHI